MIKKVLLLLVLSSVTSIAAAGDWGDHRWDQERHDHGYHRGWYRPHDRYDDRYDDRRQAWREEAYRRDHDQGGCFKWRFGIKLWDPLCLPTPRHIP